jgi:hypothetical protein
MFSLSRELEALKTVPKAETTIAAGYNRLVNAMKSNRGVFSTDGER